MKKPVVSCDVCHVQIAGQKFIGLRFRATNVMVRNTRIPQGRAFIPTGLPLEICVACVPKILGMFGYEVVE